jgi:DNA polymerase-3 subunit alpha
MQEIIHLRVHSEYSFGHGAIKIKNLVKHCAAQKMPALALTDKHNLFAALEFSLACCEAGVQPIIGSVIKVDFSSFFNNQLEGKYNVCEVLVIAKNQIGWQNLLNLISNEAAASGEELIAAKGINYSKLIELSDGLLLLCGGLDSPIYRCLAQKKLDVANNILDDLNKHFNSHFYLEIHRHGLPEEQELEEFLLEYAYAKDVPIVAVNQVAFLTPDMYQAQDVLLCITGGYNIYEDNRKKAVAAHYFKSAAEMKELFADLPEALANTSLIAKRCSVMAQANPPLLPSFACAKGRTEQEELSLQAYEGLQQKLQNIAAEKHQEYFDRLEYELKVVESMKYPGYFLIVSDFIRWSKQQGIPVGPGRGSGAGSVVAWALQITDLDPLRFGLLFERFLNPERVSMPDFDIDFCQERRDEVISYVQSKYGVDKVAQIVTFGKLQARAVLRDVGRVLSFGYGQINEICKKVPYNPANPITLAEAINLDKELQQERINNPEIKQLLDISLQLEGMTRHVSTHAAGIVIADRPLLELVPLYRDHNSSMPAVQYSMKYAEIAGLVKFDFLGLKTLTMISWACKLIEDGDFDISSILLDDEKTYQMLARGETIGVFQFESAGMREAIKKLKPDKIDDLIALGSLYRPGPMDNIPQYINRKHGLEKAEYLHPALESILQETYGIIVYQEQVMEIAQKLAGYTLGGADLLRRAMGKKIKSEMEAQRQIFVEGAISNNVKKELAVEIFNLVEKFASYGFNKSHAAAYALISYQTAYLKANYPLAFLIASINLEIDDTDKIATFLQEAKRLGITCLNPDINRSDTLFSPEDNSMRFGLSAIKNAGKKAIDAIINERKTHGEFKDIFDFAARCSAFLNKRLFENLARAGAFANLHKNRQQLFLATEQILQYGANYLRDKNTKQAGLFDKLDSALHKITPELPEVDDWQGRHLLEAEFAACGLYLSMHPLEPYQSLLAHKRVVNAGSIEIFADSSTNKMAVAGVINAKRIRSSARKKYAFIQLSDLHGIIEVSIFNEELLVRNLELLEVGALVYFEVDVRKDETGLRIIASNILPIDEALKNVDAECWLYINEQADLELINKYFKPQGRRVVLVADVADKGKVFFKVKKPLYIANDDIAVLRTLKGVKLVEK